MAVEERKVLVLQGGGALGAYQAGAYATLAEAGHEPDWIAGISIGAINAAIIAGNRKAERVRALRGFWERISSGLPDLVAPNAFLPRRTFTEAAAAWVTLAGVPGFFAPRGLAPMLAPDATPGALSWYDTEPLARTLAEFVDFDWLNREGPRLSLGAVEVATGNFTYFDSRPCSRGMTRIDARHVMASGALPPGFPPVEIDGSFWWDGGLVSNTPLQHVLDEADGTPLCIFQFDLFSARGEVPRTIFDVAQREKDIRYSSRTRLTTDRYRQLIELRMAARRLADRLGEPWKDDPDLRFLTGAAEPSPVTLVHLIRRGAGFEAHSKDYEFSRLTMTEHWAAGARDVRRLLASPEWRGRVPAEPGLTILDPESPSGHRRIHVDPAA